MHAARALTLHKTGLVPEGTTPPAGAAVRSDVRVALRWQLHWTQMQMQRFLVPSSQRGASHFQEVQPQASYAWMPGDTPPRCTATLPGRPPKGAGKAAAADSRDGVVLN